MRKLHLALGSLAARPPVLTVGAVVGSVLASWWAVATGLRTALVPADLWPRISENLALNFGALGAALLVLGGIRVLVPERWFVAAPRPQGLALFYGAYALAGAAAGLVWHGLASVAGFEVLGQTMAQQAAQVALIGFSVLGVGFVANQYRSFMERIRGQRQRLGQQVKELERSRQLIAAGEERLRRRVADVLHGPVQTKLLMTWFRLGDALSLMEDDPKKARELVENARNEVDHVRDREVRDLSHLLHPSAINVGLVAAMERLVGSYGESVRLALHVDPSVAELDVPGRNRIPEEVRLVAHRVLEEALGNVYRHADATSVDISLRVEDGKRLEMVVEDDGRGFAAHRVELGLGLSNIAARVGQVGGRWHISSAVDVGTTLTVILPCGSSRSQGGEEDVAESAFPEDRLALGSGLWTGEEGLHRLWPL